jgi:hypothetical protein
MRQISISAVIVSNLVQLGSTLSLIVLAALATLATAWTWAGFPEEIKPITEGLKSSSLLVPLIGAISIIPSSILAGYVAGRMARRRPILHGALSSCAWLLLLILIILFGIPTEHPPHGGPPAASHAGSSIGSFLLALLGTTISIGTPLLGALGGLIVYQGGHWVPTAFGPRRKRRAASEHHLRSGAQSDVSNA